MHICRVTRAFIPLRDGISHHTYYLSKHQVSLGHKVWVLQPHHPAGQLDGVQVKWISLGRLTPKYGDKRVTALFAFLAGFKILRLHARHKFDVIHGHGDVIEAFILKQFARVLGLPVVMTMHSGLNRRRLYRWVAPLTWRMADGVIAVSQEIALDLQSLGVNPDRLAVISSGVQLSRFNPATEESRQEARRVLGIPDPVFVITAVGKLVPVKGFRHLIEAVQTLADIDTIQLYIIGDGPIRSELQGLIRLPNHIHLVGYQPQDCIRSFLHATDLFILPSVDQSGVVEGTPTAVMEAMATGLPVITTDSGGAKHAIEAIGGLTIVPQRDSRALADAILRFATDSELRKDIGELNRERVMCRDWPRIASEVCQFYETVITFARR